MATYCSGASVENDGLPKHGCDGRDLMQHVVLWESTYGQLYRGGKFELPGRSNPTNTSLTSTTTTTNQRQERTSSKTTSLVRDGGLPSYPLVSRILGSYSPEKFSRIARATGMYDTVNKNSEKRFTLLVKSDQYDKKRSPPMSRGLCPMSR